MINFPEPSCRTTLAIAHFLRPVPIIFCAANPPGSLDFTRFSRSSVSTYGSATEAEEVITKVGKLGTWDFKDRGFNGAIEREGTRLGEILEENEREATDEVRAEMEVATAIDGGVVLTGE